MKKLKRIVASLLAVLMLLGVAPVTALAGEIELHRINTTQQPAEEPAQEPVLGSEDVLPEEDVAEAAEPAAVSGSSLDYRIVHLDCGRKYFSVEYIKSVIDTMAENGFNQLELAFGNGGLRFVLDNMDIKSESSTLHNSEDVKAAIRQGNERFYNDPNGNSLSETDMKAIITYARAKVLKLFRCSICPDTWTACLAATFSPNTNFPVRRALSTSTIAMLLISARHCLNFM